MTMSEGNHMIQNGDTVRYTGWLPGNQPAFTGIVQVVTGQSFLLDVDGVQRWVDCRNVKKVIACYP